jgi:hypothetical protein
MISGLMMVASPGYFRLTGSCTSDGLSLSLMGIKEYPYSSFFKSDLDSPDIQNSRCAMTTKSFLYRRKMENLTQECPG